MITVEILSCSVENLNIQYLDMVAPYEISDSAFVDKKYCIFKEIFYVNSINILI